MRERAQKGRTIPFQEVESPISRLMKEIKNRQPKDNNGAKEIDLTKEEQKTAESSVPQP